MGTVGYKRKIPRSDSKSKINSSSKKRSLSFMKSAELGWKLKSKADFYVYLAKHLQYFLPPEAHVNKDFLKDVLVGKKHLMKKHQVNYINVPHYDELSVVSLWPDLKKDADFMAYFPAVYPKGRGPPRDYFFNVLHTVKPDYL